MANRSFEMYEYRQVLLRMQQGATDREIARSRLMGRKKARQVREIADGHGWLDPAVTLPVDAMLAEGFARKPATSSVSPLAQHHDAIQRWVEQNIQQTTILSLLRRRYGYTGSYSSVRRYVARLRPASTQATIRLEFDPGDAAQVDFGQGPKLIDPSTATERTPWIFVMTLCWSRHQYAEIVWDQKSPTWLACHQRAFRFFGGVPRRIILDNAKCAITKACRRDPEIQRAYYELAEAFDVRLDVCPPRRPELKGRVESGVKYIKRSFVPGRTFRNKDAANRQLEAWVLGEAGQRIHGTTRQRPLDRFAETEQPLLQPVPERAWEPAEWKRLKLARDGHVRVDGAFYSAPWIHVGETLQVKATATMVQIYHGYELVATHTRCESPGEKRTVFDHLPPNAQAYLRQTPAWCRERADAIGPTCRAVIDQLLADRVVERLDAARGVIGLAKHYSPERVESACRRALTFEDPRYRTVKTILSRGLDQVALVEDAFDDLCDTYTGAGRFTRDTRNLLSH